MKTETGATILNFIKKSGEVSAKAIIDFAGLSPQAVFRQLKKLQQQGTVTKTGSPPHVFYSPTVQRAAPVTPKFLSEEAKTIDKEFLTVTPTGLLLEGTDGFAEWCAVHKLDAKKTASEYLATLKKYHAHQNSHGLIDGLPKMQATFSDVYLNKLFYLDFYAIERFGKTKLGALILYAKQSQNKLLVKKIIEIIKPSITALILRERVDVVAFIPPTIPRGMQLQKELERQLALPLPTIKLIKAGGQVAVPQKSLSKLADRITNAERTIFVEGNKPFKNVLLIDDAVGSGATLNETARKIKERKLCTGKIIGLALVGSFKGFEVISEV